jgi:hypothetical protein
MLNGQPIPRLDSDGAVVGFDEPLMEHRVKAAQILINKLVPDVKAVEISSSTDNALTIQLVSGIDLPNSVSKDEPVVLERIADDCKH